MADKKIIMKFKKTASPDDKAKIIDDLKAKGAQMKDTDHVNSKLMPFVAMSLPDHHYEGLASDVMGGHDVIEHVEEDQEMRIQI